MWVLRAWCFSGSTVRIAIPLPGSSGSAPPGFRHGHANRNQHRQPELGGADDHPQPRRHCQVGKIDIGQGDVRPPEYLATGWMASRSPGSRSLIQSSMAVAESCRQSETEQCRGDLADREHHVTGGTTTRMVALEDQQPGRERHGGCGEGVALGGERDRASSATPPATRASLRQAVRTSRRDRLGEPWNRDAGRAAAPCSQFQAAR